MRKEYFHRVASETRTRFWVNNPTLEDAERAIAAGAISCTANPSFCSQIIKAESESAQALSVIDHVIQQTSDDNTAADLVQQRLVKRIMEKFLPLYELNPGREGFVSIQGNPYEDEDPDYIVEEALRFRNLSKNFITKIPCTEAGLKAIEILIGEDMPIIATEVFAIAQVTATCELYRRVSERTGKRPPFYVTHITGIFDEYLTNFVKREGIRISPEVLFQAGCYVARKQYRLMQERGYPGVMLGGGARGPHHFTEFVGGSIHITINWSTARDLLEANAPVIPRMDTPLVKEVVDELCQKLPDFRKAFLDDGLTNQEFKDFEPLQYFRGMFIKGWDTLVQNIRDRRRIAALSPTFR